MRKSEQMGGMVLHVAAIGIAPMIRIAARTTPFYGVCPSRARRARVAPPTLGIAA